MGYYVNPVSTYAIGILFPIICTASVLTRLKSRKMTSVPIGADDWMAITALVFTIACGAIMIIGAATHTIGYHSPDLTAEQSLVAYDSGLILISKLQYAFYPISVLALGAVRTTFLLLYRRIFQLSKASIPIMITVALVVGWVLAFFWGDIFQCGIHFFAIWSTEAAVVQYCTSATPLQVAMFISDAVLDVVILVIPIVPVCHLQMSVQRKLLCLLLFSVGIFSVAASIARTVFAVEVLNYPIGSTKKIFGLAGTSDALGVLSTLFWWSYLQLGVGCFVSNLPASVGFFKCRDWNIKQSFNSLTVLPLRKLRNTTTFASSRRESSVNSKEVHEWTTESAKQEHQLA